MAKKKVEIALQEEINTQEEWEATLLREGLIVVDIYQDWCGPCKAVSGLFKRLKNELNDDLLHFVIAKADTIESLEKHRGRSQPCFHFYGGGCLVAAVEGVNPPELEKCIIDKLKQEHEVLKGEAERVEIRDPLVVAIELEEAEIRRRLEEEEEVIQQVSVLVIKPDLYSAGKGDEIIEQLAEHEIEVLDRKEFTFTDSDVANLYEEQQASPLYRDILHFLTSGPSEILLCTKSNQNIIEDLRKIIGPAIPESDEEEIEPLRSKYSADLVHSAFHVPQSKEEVEKDLTMFFPDYEPAVVRVKRAKPLVSQAAAETPKEEAGEVSPFLVLSCNLPDTQRTVAIIRPEAYANYKIEILDKIREAGFQIAIQKEIEMTLEQAQEYYKEQADQPHYDKLIEAMTSGPCLVLLLSKPNAINSWREIIGPADPEEAISLAPESLRARFMTTESGFDELTPKKSDGSRDKSKSEDKSNKSAKERTHDDEAKDDETKASQDETKAPEDDAPAEEDIPKEESNSNSETTAPEEEPGEKQEGEEEATDTKPESVKEVSEHQEKVEEELGEKDSVVKESINSEKVYNEGQDGEENLGDNTQMEKVPRKVRINLIHGSVDEQEAERDIGFFFPIERTIAAIKPDAFANRDEIIDRIKENGFCIEARKELQVTTEIAQEMYKHVSTKGFFEDLINHMKSGKSLFLLLARQDAIACWRQLIGHTDPDKAADEASDNIRATYGRNIIANAVYGARNAEEVQRIKELVFTEPPESVHESGEGVETEPAEQDAESAVRTEEGEKDETVVTAEGEERSAAVTEGETEASALVSKDKSEVSPPEVLEADTKEASAEGTKDGPSSSNAESDSAQPDTQPEAVSSNQNAAGTSPRSATPKRSMSSVSIRSNSSQSARSNQGKSAENKNEKNPNLDQDG